MGQIRYVILDWSGTLVDDFLPVVHATNQIFIHYGKKPFTEDEFREKFYLPFNDFYKEYLPPEALPELETHYHKAFKNLQTNIHPLPYAIEFLEYLMERGIPTFLLSTIHEDHFHEQGSRLGVKKYFKQAYTMAFDKRKTILQLLAEHNLKPDETIFIGDMLHDIETAKHAGVTSCAVLTGYDSLNKLKKAQPDLIFKNLRLVMEFMERHSSEPPASPPLATVGALIANEKQEFLLIQTHKWSHKWGIPGGKIKYGEPSIDALHREVLEETGLKVRDVKFEMVQDCIEPAEFYKKAHFLLINYTAVTPTTDVTLNHEAENHTWLPIEEALKLDLNTPSRILLEHVRSHSNR